MPQYKVKDPTTGRTIVLTGDSPPTAAELEQIFAEINKEPEAPAPPPEGQSHPGIGMRGDLMMGGIGLAKGAAKSLGNSAIGLGRIMSHVPGVSALAETIGGQLPEGVSLDRAGAAIQEDLKPQNTAEHIGQIIEQLLEFAGPGLVRKGATSLAGRMATEGATGAGVAAAQGGDALTTGGVSAALPLAGRVASAVGKKIGEKAIPLVRSAVKPTVTQLKQIAGASATGIEFQANKLAKFILDNGIATASQARAIIDDAEKAIQSAIKRAGNPITDAPQRAAYHLDMLEKSAAKQLLPKKDVAAIRAKAKELIETSRMGETVEDTVMKPSPSGLVDASGKVVEVPTKEARRVLRTDVRADEALETARKTSEWKTKKAYGEMKGADTEAAKAGERGTRNAVKKAVPETAPHLRKQGQAIDARNALDRMEQRAGNRDQVSLPGLVGASASAVLGAAAHWLRNNQLKAGRYARALELAIADKDVQKVSDIMARLGVGGITQAVPATSGR
jgi:hypothetical protein